MTGRVKEKTAHNSAMTATMPPTHVVLVTDPVSVKTMPPIADPSAMPICSAELLKLCWMSDVAGSVSIK